MQFFPIIGVPSGHFINIVLTDSPEDYMLGSMKQRVCNTVEAKAKLNELLDDVVNGDVIIIQRRGKAVARLSATDDVPENHQETTEIFLRQLRDFHRRVRRNHSKKSHTVEILRQLREDS